MEHDHPVIYGVRNPSERRHDPSLVGGEIASIKAAATAADVILFAVPWHGAQATAVQIAQIGNRVLIDATNPLAGNQRNHDRNPNQSGAEWLASELPDAQVVKAFNSTGASNMANTDYGLVRPMMPIAGDDSSSKALVADLATELGFEAVDAGPLASARDLEHLAVMWIRLAYTLGNGPDIAFSLNRRTPTASPPSSSS